MTDSLDPTSSGDARLSDDLQLQDAIRVNVSRPSELKYWLDRFGVSREKLQEAVDTVGTTAGDVAVWLRVSR